VQRCLVQARVAEYSALRRSGLVLMTAHFLLGLHVAAVISRSV